MCSCREMAWDLYWLLPSTVARRERAHRMAGGRIRIAIQGQRCVRMLSIFTHTVLRCCIYWRGFNITFSLRKQYHNGGVPGCGTYDSDFCRYCAACSFGLGEGGGGGRAACFLQRSGQRGPGTRSKMIAKVLRLGPGWSWCHATCGSRCVARNEKPARHW